MPSDLYLHERLDRYVRSQAKGVSGWLAPESAAAIASLAELQSALGLAGGAGEIGIHHGKLFLLLYQALAPDERAFAIDVFGAQEFNVDASGLGDKQIFLANLACIGGSTDRITILERDSTTVQSAEILAAMGGPIRLMSVDGGHTQAITHSDLRLGDAILQPGGILILDDVYQERWPAVAAGAFAFLAEPGSRLRPFAITPNKTYFCQDPKMAATYRAHLAERFNGSIVGKAEMFGSEVLILGRRTLVNRIRNLPLVRDNPALYRRLSGLLHSVRG